MGKLLVTVGAIAALSFLAYRAMYGHAAPVPGDAKPDVSYREPSAPKQTLDNVRAKAKSIEANDNRYIDKMADDTKSP